MSISISRRRHWMVATAVASMALAALAGGCRSANWKLPGMGPRAASPPEGSVKIPEPVSLLLPKSISIHPFTGTRQFSKGGGGLQGIDVRLEAKDAYGDANKAFGKFRFELYEFRPFNPDPRGKLVYVWEEDLLDPEKNIQHWNIHRTYEFKLLWDRPIEVGRQFVLRAIFTSPFTKQLYDERTFVSGQ